MHGLKWPINSARTRTARRVGAFQRPPRAEADGGCVANHGSETVPGGGHGGGLYVLERLAGADVAAQALGLAYNLR